jgi:NAD(P)-dependent dehydrogenase (short-subunit alcohol dehydrogenase family)
MAVADGRLQAMETALVTGATGGIGGAIARRLAAMGMHVFATGRRLADAEAFAQGVNANELIEGRCTGLELDVTNGDSVVAMVQQLEAIGVTGVDWLINNAGSAETAPGTREGNHALMRRLMELNLYGPVRLFDVFGRGMLDRQRGGMIQVASSAGLKGYAYVSAYAATKHAMLGWTRSLALECAPKGVIVSAVCPHYVDTPMTDRSIESMHTRSGRSEAELRSFLASENPGGVFVTPEEVADSIVDLMHSNRGGVLIELPGGSRQIIEAGVPLVVDGPSTPPPAGSPPGPKPSPPGDK